MKINKVHYSLSLQEASESFKSLVCLRHICVASFQLQQFLDQLFHQELNLQTSSVAPPTGGIIYIGNFIKPLYAVFICLSVQHWEQNRVALILHTMNLSFNKFTLQYVCRPKVEYIFFFVICVITIAIIAIVQPAEHI